MIFTCLINSVYAQDVTISYTGPNPIPVLSNCVTNYTFKKSDFQYTPPPGCTVDTAVDVELYQATTQVILGQMLEVSVQVIDNCNHFTTKQFQIPVADITGPQFVIQPASLTIGQCGTPQDNQNFFLNWIGSHAGATATDNCMLPQNITWSINPVNPVLPIDFCTPADLTVQFIAHDQFDNMTLSNVVHFKIIDTIGPLIISKPRDTSFVCTQAIKSNIEQLFNSWMNTLANNTAKASDVCSGINVSWYVKVDNGPEQKLPIFVMINPSSCLQKSVSFIAKDICNNKTTVGTAKFSMTDNVVPQIVKPAANLTHQCNGNNANLLAWNAWLSDHGSARFKDNCTDSLLLTYSLIPPVPIFPGNTCSDSARIIFVASDLCGNKTLSQASFYLRDDIAPVISNVPADVNYYCSFGAIPPVPNNVTVSDNCDNSIVIQFQQASISGDCGPNSVVTRTWTAADSCGNITIKIQKISVIDTVPPVLTGAVPANITVNCENIPSPPNLNSFSATDDCDSNVDIIMKDINNIKSCNGTYTIIRLWIATDNCGNVDSLSQKITVIDNQPPILFGVPADVSVNCDNIPQPPILGVGITSTDNCDANVDLTYNQSSTISACTNKKYTITRTWTAADGCGNLAVGTQHITVTDNQAPVFTNAPPNLTVDCSNIPFPPLIGGTFNAIDGCDTMVHVNFAQVNNQNPDSTDCSHYNYTITRFWVADDDCGNITTLTQIIQVKDTLAPTLVCVDTFIIPNLPTQCLAIKAINELVFFSDGCSNITGNKSIGQTLFLSHTGVDPEISPIDTLVFNLPIQGVPAFYITGNINLKIDLNNIDAEASTEFFKVYAEDGTYLGNTAHTPTQCGSSVTNFILSAQKVNQWAFDGNISFILVTSGNGVNPINDICPGGNVKTTLTYDYLTSPAVSYNLYYGIDGSPLKQFLPGKLDTFSLGEHKIKIKVSDCSNNFDTCSYILKVIDNDAPTITCPNDLTAQSLPFDCNALIFLPEPINLGDNCGFSTLTSNTSTPTFLFFEDLPGVGMVPKSVSVNFFGQPPIGNGTLKIYIKGDIAQQGEFFYVYDENNNLIDSTSQGSPILECNEYQAFTIPLSKAQITQWAQDATIKFTIKPNINTALYSEFINPCGVVDNQNKDNISMVYFEFVYPSFDINYVVKDSNNVVIDQGKYITATSQTPIPYGKHTITYTINDGSGNFGSCSFKATVFDKTKPTLICKSGAIIDLNPSGLVLTKIKPKDILFSDYDNCGIRDYVITPNNISCNLAGTGTTISIVATDYSGNKDSCTSIVFFRNEPLTPTLVQDTCGGVLVFYPDTTFTQPTPGTGNFFSYSWVGPNMFYSPLPSPSIISPGPSYSGTYTLTITGLTGCQSSGSINLSIDQDGLFKPTVYSNSPVCQGDTIVIYTDWNGALSYTWTNVNNSTQIITSQNFLRIPAEPQYSGAWTVLVGLNVGCNSKTSNPHNVQVNLVGVNATDSISVCKGAKTTLNVDAINGSIYKWKAPNGSFYFGKNPEVPGIQGTYTVTVTNTSGCTAVDSTYVKINERPQITALSHSCPACVSGTENCSIEPSVFPLSTGNYKYEWYNPLNTLFSIDSIAQLTNLTAGSAGQYMLIVTDQKTGCISASSQININLNNTPLTPLIELDTLSSGSPDKICAGEPIILKLQSNAYSGSVKYIWDTPLGKDTTSVPSLSYPSANINNKGFYKLQVLINGCISNISNQIFIDVNAIPFPPIPGVNGPICEGDSLKLSTALIPGATYEWSGPTGAFSNLQNPFIANAKPGDSGSYRVRINLNGCISLYSSPVVAEVNPTPQTPSLLQDCNGVICVDAPNANCLFRILAFNSPPGTLFNYYFETGQKITGPVSSDSLFLTNLSQFGAGSKQFYSTIVSKGCESEKSLSITLQLDTIPNQTAFAGNDLSLCETEALNICATGINVGTAVWNQISGPPIQILNPNASCTDILGYTGGQNLSFSWTLSNGACINYSIDTLNVSVSKQTTASAFPLIKVCLGEDINLTSFSGDGTWKQSDSQAQAGVIIENPTAKVSAVLNAAGNQTYYFNWLVDNGACGISEAEVIVQVYDDNAYAGFDREDCGQGCLKDVLLANTPLYGSGIWTSPDQGINIESPTQPKTAACGLKDGPNIFYWSTNNGICGLKSIDTVVINYQLLSTAVSDTFKIAFASNAFIDVLDNDILVSDYTLVLTKNPERGKLKNIGNGKFSFTSDPDFVGQDFFTYKLCSVLCPDECTETTVILNIGQEVTCTTPSIITPNGDGVNDAFIVPCLALIDKYPLNKLAVFNQWGDEVYTSENYQNNWEGTYQGQALQAGTYFYILDLGDGSKPISGFLIVKK